MGHIMDFGKLDGRKIELVVLKSGSFVACVSTYGAALVWFGTKDRNYVTYHSSGEKYIDDSTYMGKVVGPYANRIEGASFSIGEKRYGLEKNDGDNNLHSGSSCFGNKLWSIEGISDSMVTLSLSTEEEGGFPGRHETEVSYYLTSEGMLTILYKATSTERCPVALTNHAYFVLDDRDSRSLSLMVEADQYIAVDSALIPLPENPVSVENTDFDFRTRTKVGERRDGKYDNSWVLKKGALVTVEGNRASLSVKTTEPGIQIYTGEFMTGEDAFPFKGIALETGSFPNSPNRPDFCGKYTDNGEYFQSMTSYFLVPKE